MKQDDDHSGDRDSWGQILSRCGPGLAEGDEDTITPRAIDTNEPEPRARVRLRISRWHIATLIGLTLVGSVVISHGSLRRDQEKSGTGNELKAASIAALPSTLVSREPLAGEQPPALDLNGSDPASDGNEGVASEGDANKAGLLLLALPSATDNVGGPFLPAQPKAGDDPTVREALQARLPRSGDSKVSEQSAVTDDPAASAALRDLRLRQDLDEIGLPLPLAKSSSLSTVDAQRLIDRGMNLMSLGDVVTARLIFQKVMESGYGEGTFNLAQSYDPEVLGALPAHAFVKGDAQKAKMLYALAEKTEKTIPISR